MAETEDYLRIFYCLSVIIAVIDAANINCINSIAFTITIISNLGIKLLLLPCHITAITLCLCLLYELLFVIMFSIFLICEDYECQLWFHVYRQIFNTINIFLLYCMFKTRLIRRRDVRLRVYVEIPEPEILPISYETVELQADWECCICLEGTDENIFMLTCGHMIHEQCAVQWFTESMTCPLCRTNI